MAAFVTFTSVSGRDSTIPVEGAQCRTETVALGAQSALRARASESVVVILAEENCWVSIGGSPNATSGENRRPMAAGAEKAFATRMDDAVAIAAR